MTRTAIAALVVALAGVPGCCARGASPTYTVRNGAARAPAPPPPLAAREVRALHFADFGDRTPQQAAVAQAMEIAHRRSPFDVAFAAGDLVYPCGPDAALPGAERCAFAPGDNAVEPGTAVPDDPSFAAHDAPLAFLGTTPVHPALGNHDVAARGRCGAGDPVAVARRKACLAVARSAPQWVMPGRHYAVDAGPARFIVVDSNLVERDYGGFSLDDEVAFVATQAEGCRERICFLVGHHPPVSAGSHGRDATPAVAARMDRLLAAGGGRIRAYLAGHDHDLQHLRSRHGLDVFVSGAGARGRPRERLDETPAGAQLLFGSVRWGYGIVEVSPDGWRYRFEDDRAAPLYCCTAAGGGPCEPTTCP
jgi:hypothetical protein